MKKYTMQVVCTAIKITPPPSPSLPKRVYAKGRFDKGRGRGGGWKILFSLLIFHFLLSTIHCSLSYAEGLSDIKIDALRAPVKSIDERWGKDPFVRYEDRVLRKERPLKEELPLDLKVDGIISDGKKALAIINGGFYRKHERVNNFLIVDIKKDGILLEKNGIKLYLGINKFVIESALRGGKK